VIHVPAGAALSCSLMRSRHSYDPHARDGRSSLLEVMLSQVSSINTSHGLDDRHCVLFGIICQTVDVWQEPLSDDSVHLGKAS
jgi:hypothetical protein